MKKTLISIFVCILLIIFVFLSTKSVLNKEVVVDKREDVGDQKIVIDEDKDKMINNIYDYLNGEWILSEYINLVWYPTGEDDDELLRADYEKKYKKYLGKSIQFSKDNLFIPVYDDGINVYSNSNDYIYKFSIDKILDAPIVEVYGEYKDGENENIRLIFDGNGGSYLEYKSFFFKIDRVQ